MNEIKIFLKESGSIAELYKDFNLYEGAYRNAQISVYVPKSLLYTIPAANIAPAVKTGAILTAPNGSKVTTDSHGADYVKDETVGNVAYSVFTQILPKEYCMYAGTQTLVVNVVNVDGTNASAPSVVSVITSQTAQIAVQESAYVADEQILDPTQAEAIQAQQTAQDVRITKNETDIAALQEEVQQNTANISKNAGDIADLQAQMATGENYIGQMKGFSLPTSEQLGTFVENHTNPSRAPQSGDSVIFLLQSFEEDGTISEKPYKYLYGASGWSGYEISPIQTAENGTAGLVSGTYGVDSENNLLADITGGKIVELYFKGADGEYKPVSSSLSSLISTLDGIIGGTVGVGLAGMAIRDRNGNIIDITYQTKEEGATKEFVENYALPKTFSDVKYISADGYSDTVPTTPSNGIQFSVGTSGTSTFEVFELDRTLADGYELTKNNSTTNVLWIMSGVSDTPSFRLVTQAKKASESAWTTLSSQESGPVVMESGTPVKVTFYSNFSALDSATVSIADGDEIRQVLYVTPGTSATNAYAVYSSATYPSTFIFNTNTLAVGELSGDFVTTNTAQTISGAKTFTNGATAVQPNNTTPAFSATYSGGILSFYADKITYLPASGGNTYTFTFPSENGVFALVSDINALDSTLRAYIAQQLALKFDKTGGTISGSVNVTDSVTAGGDVNAQSGNFSEGITVDKQITLRGNPEADTSSSVLQHKEYGFNFYDVEEGTDLSGKSLFFDTGISPLEDSNFNGTSLETLISFQNGYTLYVNPNVSPSNYSVYMSTPSGGSIYFYLNGQWMADVYTFTGSGWVVESIEKENFESDAAQILADMLVVGTFFVPSRTRFDDGAQIPLTPLGAFDVPNKQYVDGTVKTESGYLQQAIDNEASARAAADTALRNSKYDKTGGTIGGDVQITGDLTVNGTTTTNDAETLQVKDNYIVTNSDGATLAGYSGILIRTNSTVTYGIAYDPVSNAVLLGQGVYNSDGTFSFNPGEGLPVAIRAVSTSWTNGDIAVWDSTNNQFVDSGKSISDLQAALTFDNVPTQGSGNPVTSGGIYTALQSYATLSALEAIINSETIEPVNKLDLNSLAIGQYLNVANGILLPNTDYDTTDFIPAKNGDILHYQYTYNGKRYDSATNNYARLRFVCTYDKNKNFIAGYDASISPFTITDENTAYIRVTLYVHTLNTGLFSDCELLFLDETVIVPFTEYFTPYTIVTITDDALALEERTIIQNLQSSINKIPILPALQISQSKTSQFLSNCFSSAKEQVITFSAVFSEFTSLNIGLTKTSNYSTDLVTYIEITTTEIIIHYSQFGTEQAQTISHGLTIQDFLGVEFNYAWNLLTISLTTIGGVFDSGAVTVLRYGSGFPFYDFSATSPQVLNFSNCYPKINKKAWLFGDSYTSNSNDRWVYYVNKDYTFFNGYSGQGSSTAIIELEYLLTLGKPKYVVWCLGMNDTNSVWQTAYETLIQLSQEYGFEIILQTIPTVPSVNNETKTSTVRASGYRYIEVYDAVGATSSGTWFPGLLSSDNVHPSVAGAKVIAAEVLADFPEILIE